MNPESAIRKVVREHSLKIAEWREEKVVEAIVQAFKAGDFVTYVSEDDSFAVLYLPYEGVRQLKRRVTELEETLKEIKGVLTDTEF